MKLTISIPDEMKRGLDSYIAKRFGSQRARAVSLVIREALHDFLSKQEEAIEEKIEQEQKKLK